MAACVLLAAVGRGQSYTVTSGTGTGEGTLPFAIQQANLGLVSEIDFAPGVLEVAAGGQMFVSANVVIRGGGVEIDMGGSDRAFFIAGGTVRIEDVTIANGHAQGGLGGYSGGGGAGLGGAIFVADGTGIPGSGVAVGTNVTLSRVFFGSNGATGGNGGTVVNENAGGGGGLGGAGGMGFADFDGGGGGGGGFGNGAVGATASHTGEPGAAGGFAGAAGAGAGGHSGTDGGANGGGGGAGTVEFFVNGAGGGGGVGGAPGVDDDGGDGGFGGGGGGGPGSGAGGNGGFGGGGGAGDTGGNGGFGGGGGGSLSTGDNPGGSGGFAGGAGSGTTMYGGGGAGLGGALFVMAGANVTVEDCGFSDNWTAGGAAGGDFAGAGLAGGDSMFLGATVTYRVTSGATTLFGSLGGGGIDGANRGDPNAQGGLVKEGAGRLILEGGQTFVGGTFVNGGTLEMKGTSMTNGYTVQAGTLRIAASDGNTHPIDVGSDGALVVDAAVGTLIGDITVNGTLEFNGNVTNALEIALASGGRMSGTGSMDTVILEDGGTLAPGTFDGAGVLDINLLSWNGGGTVAVALGSSYVLAGAVEMGDIGVYSFSFDAEAAEIGQSYVLLAYTTTDFSPEDFTFTSNVAGLIGEFAQSFDATLNRNALTFRVMAVPEPATWAAAVFCLAAAAGFRARRARQNQGRTRAR